MVTTCTYQTLAPLARPMFGHFRPFLARRAWVERSFSIGITARHRAESKVAKNGRVY